MKKLILSLAVIAALFTACSDDDKKDDVLPDTGLAGDIKDDRVLEAMEYTLEGTLRVTDGASLTIPAGTTIKGEGFGSYILVERGGQIFINGTADKPVVMTSSKATPAAGDWGGLIINGAANISGTEAGTEGTTEVDASRAYGGTKDDDNSGSIKYLILEYTGAKSSANVEHNGLTLNAVGNKTVIENVYVPNGSDDGVEFFGGSVNVTNLLVVNSDDDMFDITQGWTGTLTNAYGIWESGYTSTEGDPRGVESDGNLDGLNPDHIQQSDYSIVNMTIENKSTFQMHDAIKVRRGATATITNALVKTTDDAVKDLVDLTDGKGLSTDDTNISVSYSGLVANEIIKEKDGKTCNADVTVNPATANTGADASKFAWTKYSF